MLKRYSFLFKTFLKSKCKVQIIIVVAVELVDTGILCWRKADNQSSRTFFLRTFLIFVTPTKNEKTVKKLRKHSHARRKHKIWTCGIISINRRVLFVLSCFWFLSRPNKSQTKILPLPPPPFICTLLHTNSFYCDRFSASAVVAVALVWFIWMRGST